MKMKDLAAGERPREKMLERGAASLSDGELLAVLLRTGTREESALEVARGLLSECQGSLLVLGGKSLEALTMTKGVGVMKAATLVASFELGRRFFAAGVPSLRERVNGPLRIYETLRPWMKGLDHEECWVVYLNNANHVLDAERVFVGGMDSTVMDVRMIVRMALERRSTGIVLSHNHPSGDPHPSIEDIKETERLKQALLPFGIALVDHVVFSDSSYYSFADECCVML